MASRWRLHPPRLGAVMAVLCAPVLAWAGPDIDAKELRARLKAVEARTSASSLAAVDVAALRAELGLTSAAAPAATGFGGAGGLFSMPSVTNQPQGSSAIAAPSTGPVKQGGLLNMAPVNSAQPESPSARAATAPVTVTPKPAARSETATPLASVAPRPAEPRDGTAVPLPSVTPKAAAPRNPAAVPLVSVTPKQADQRGGGPVARASARPAISFANGADRKPVDVSTTNFRLMLATLAQTYSAANNLSVIMAQGERGTTAVSVRSGTVRLSDLQAFSAQLGFAPLVDGTLTAPVVLWPDATLVLRPGERLAMARDKGAFIMSMGRIEIDGALIEAVGPLNSHVEQFNPFLTVVGGGALDMRGATVRGLGFGRTRKFAGVTVAGNPLMQSGEEVVIENSLFDDVRAVSIAGAADAVVMGNTFQNARSNALSISGAPRARVTGNLFRGRSPTNAVRIELGSDNTLISQNVFLSGNRVAILVNGGSNHVTVRENVIWRRNGAGIKFLNSQCGRAEGNLLVDNRQKGIEVRKSDGTVVSNNLFAGNRSAGIWVSAQARDARTAVRDNIFDGNGSGLSAATGAEIWIEANNFKRQLPKLLDGDIATLSTAVVRDLEGSGPLRISQGQARPEDQLVTLCGGDA